MRVSTYINVPCLRHRGNRVVICTRDKILLSLQCPAKIEKFLIRFFGRPGKRSLEEKYEPYMHALIIGCSISVVLRRIKEDGLL